MTNRVGYTVVRCLPELEGAPWNEITQAFMRALRPSTVRVIADGVEKSDAIAWRVTVRLDESGNIERIEQEVEVDLPDGVAHGHDLQCRLGQLLGPLP